MKNIPLHCLSLLMVLLLAISSRGQSGFMRDVLNAVKNTAQNRANNSATQATNKAIDQVDPATQSKTHSESSGGSTASPSDTAALHGVLGAFARAAAANPNDTSASDLTMKALGLMAGEKQVTAQDSAKAITAYTNATGGYGVHYEYQTTMVGKKTTTKDSSEYYFTNTGEGRGEIRIPMPGIQMNKMISIGHADQPGLYDHVVPGFKNLFFENSGYLSHAYIGRALSGDPDRH